MILVLYPDNDGGRMERRMNVEMFDRRQELPFETMSTTFTLAIDRRQKFGKFPEIEHNPREQYQLNA